MADIPWKELIDVFRLGLWIVLYISIIGLFKVLITEEKENSIIIG
jgi:hypothetical protein